jgi:hypothetical protein
VRYEWPLRRAALQHRDRIRNGSFGPFVDSSGPSPPQPAEHPTDRPKRCPTSNSLQRSLISRITRVRILPPQPTSKSNKSLGHGTEPSPTSAPSGAPEDDVAQASGVNTVSYDGSVTAPADDPSEVVLNTARPHDGGGALTAQVIVRCLPSARTPTNAGGQFE